MSYQSIKKINGYSSSALSLEKLLPRNVRLTVNRVLLWFSLLVIVLIVFSDPIGIINANIGRSVLFFVIIFILILYLLEAFYLSNYDRLIINQDGQVTSHDTAEVVFNSNKDITSSLLESPRAREAIKRCNIPIKSVVDFILSNRTHLESKDVIRNRKDNITLGDLGSDIIDVDNSFRDFLFKEGVTEEEFSNALNWVERINKAKINKRRWWSRENLSKLPSVGKHWSSIVAKSLDRYGRDITTAKIEDSLYSPQILEQLEIVLARDRGANAVLIGEEGVGRVDIIEQLAAKISSGRATHEIEHKRLYVMDTERLVASSQGDKGTLEENLITILDEAEKAGDIILAFINFPSFIESAKAIGTDAVAILDKYLDSNRIQFIATSGSREHSQTMERDSRLARRFEKISIGEPNKDQTIKIIEDVATDIENKYELFFTIQSILEIIESANKYFSDGVMPERAVDLLIEIAPWAERRGVSLVTADDVKALVSEKTGVPSGEISDKERDTLENLEEIISKRVVGQREAIEAVSGALRRARSGVSAGNKPMGSFLFLGPTGVGKTETAKALTWAFFGNEKNMLRLDMSEYRTKDSLNRLIGSFENGEIGTLPQMLKDKPYGVLLLDEFEKTNREVMDLFLQIFDEGFFSDTRGRRVNVRNHIIIATSNAESDLIWKLSHDGEDLFPHREEIVRKIVEDGIFKPELLNRFDEMILFHPLSKTEIRKIAGLMLEKLKKHLRGEGIDLIVSNELIEKIVEEGYDPHFGARPMRRAIQDHIEEPIAEKIIKGELKRGSRVTLV